MKTHVKALIVGGGAIGTSIAYHLAKFGWDDIVLLERDELTSGQRSLICAGVSHSKGTPTVSAVEA